MYEYRVKVLKVIDGDTVDVDIDLGFNTWIKNERVRLMGIDTPESRTSNDIEKKFIKGYATATGKWPNFEGSYSTAKPGKQPMRGVLRQTVAEKLFFSGEACHPTQWATVNGGLNAGKDSAKQTARYIKK